MGNNLIMMKKALYVTLVSCMMIFISTLSFADNKKVELKGKYIYSLEKKISRIRFNEKDGEKKYYFENVDKGDILESYEGTWLIDDSDNLILNVKKERKRLLDGDKLILKEVFVKDSVIVLEFKPGKSGSFKIEFKGKEITFEKDDTITNILFALLGGLGLFLLGMNNLSNGLQTVAGDRLKWLIGKVTNHRIFAATIGVVVTTIIQSSSITTVMVVGFVNAGLMTLKQAIGVIMGANIGTTITGWIVVVKIGKYGLPLLGIAALVILFSKKEKVRYIATIILGLGMIFYGLEVMKNGFKPITIIPEFKMWFDMFEATTYLGIIKCVLTGAVLTMIVQSSSATLAITIGLAMTQVISFETAAALVLGENIGTTITAFLASFGAKKTAKRAAYAHIIFNILGVMWIVALFPFYIKFISNITGFDKGKVEVGFAIATVHSVFNIANTILFLPFVGVLAAFLCKIIPVTEDEKLETGGTLTHLDIRMLEAPVMLLEQSKKEIMNMAEIIKGMMADLKTSIKDDLDDKNHIVRKIFADEEAMDEIQKEISTFLIEILSPNVSRNLAIEAKKQISYSDEYESISDYINTINKLRLKIKNKKINLSEEKKTDLFALHDKVLDYFELVNKALIEENKDIMEEAKNVGNEITEYFRKTRRNHLERIGTVKTDPLLTTAYMDILNSYRRLKDHILHVAEVIAID